MSDGPMAAGSGVVTVGEALRRCAAALAGAGVAAPGREADELYAALVRGATSAAWAERERPLSGEGLAFLAHAVARRAMGEPQAYATGWANFRGHWLRVDERVLIPRPETEGLVEVILAWARANSGARTAAHERRRANGGGPRSEANAGDGAAVRRCGDGAGLVGVDVGTGSGAVALSLALEGP